jgi:hypothetical protein
MFTKGGTMSFTGRDQTFTDTTITNNGFLPDVSVGDFQESYRIANQYSLSAVNESLELAMIEMNGRLKSRLAEWELAGYTSLIDVPGQSIASEYKTLYLASVMHWAKSELIRRNISVTTRKVSDVTGTVAEPNEIWYRRRADQYARQLTGSTGITCVLL